MNLLELKQLQTACGPPIDLAIQAQECICLSGPSGVGKSLLLRAIADLDPYSGQIWLNETPIEAIQAPLWRRQVGLLTAESGWWQERVGEHFLEDHPQLPTFLQALGLPWEALNWNVHRASSGERQRLAMARLLTNHPLVLLLDEPTANLDPASTQKVETLIKQYQAQHQAAILWVTHDQEQARRMGDKLLRIEATHGVLTINPLTIDKANLA